MSNKSSGIGLPMTLFLIFLILKLTETIDWSWWWVTSPLWIPAALLISFMIIAFIIVIVAVSLGGDIKEIKNKIEKYKK
jgi:ABC-type antimicrobial peptide transport system permease subunit